MPFICLKSCTIVSESLIMFRKITHQASRNYYESRNILKLRERGMFHDIFPEQCSNEIHQYLARESRYVYAGFDPTATSLHVGNLLILKMLLHWQRAGHKVIALIGGATALIGDPSGRYTDREQQVPDEIREQSLQIQKNIETIFKNHETYFWKTTKDPSELRPIMYVNNIEWYKKINVIEFIDKIGRQFRMGSMLLKESVRKRVESDYGMSFAEFSYQTFQAYDWYHLYKEYDCKCQIGGTDQMGNMEAGHRLIRRLIDQPSYAFTLPLITNDAGDKFGKSVSNAVWLDKNLTTPFEFYQFFIRLPDLDAYKLIKYLSFRPYQEIEDMIEKHRRAPETRYLQSILAEEMTLLVHGDKEVEIARNTTAVLYGENIGILGKINPQDVRNVLKGCTIVECKFRPGYRIIDFALDIRCFLNKNDAERIIKSGGLYINYNRALNPEEVLSQSAHVLPNKLMHLRVGKRNCYIVRWYFEPV